MSVTVKNLLSFLLALALTMVAVLALSAVTRAEAEAAVVEYQQQIQAQTESSVPQVTAVVPSEDNWLLSVGAFLLILSIPSAGLILYFRSVRRGRETKRPSGHGYRPRADMNFASAGKIRG